MLSPTYDLRLKNNVALKTPETKKSHTDDQVITVQKYKIKLKKNYFLLVQYKNYPYKYSCLITYYCFF